MNKLILQGGEYINSSAGVSKLIPGGGEQYDSPHSEHSNSAGVGEYDKSRGVNKTSPQRHD
jgi:hypothetical protein